MNAGQTAGAALAGLVVAAVGPGWALTVCGVGTLGTVPVLLSIRAADGGRSPGPGMWRELRDGWSEFRSRAWLQAIVEHYCVILMAWYGGFMVLGPAVARSHLGGPASWGAITAAESVGLVGVAGLTSLRFSPRRPMLFVVLMGMTIAVPTLALAMLWPLPLVCVCAFGAGLAVEVMMVQWTVALARHIPPDKLARVSSYDALGSTMTMPVGALIAGPLAAAIGVSATQYAAALLIVASSALALIPRQIRTIRSAAGPAPEPVVADQPAGAADPVTAGALAVK